MIASGFELPGNLADAGIDVEAWGFAAVRISRLGADRIRTANALES